MIIREKPVVVYDIEVFPNVFSCTIKNTETNLVTTFEISERKNDLTDLVRLFALDIMFCGYNNHHYDDVVINYLIDFYPKMNVKPYWQITQSLFNLSNVIINSEEGDTDRFKKWKYAHFFESMDLLTMLFSSKLRVGLKEMQVTMHYHNVLEYNRDFNDFLPKDSIDEMIEYNINDVESTAELLNRLKEDVNLRLFIEQEYGINVLSMDQTKIGEKILEKKYCDSTGIKPWELKNMGSSMDYIPLKDVILPFIAYKNPKLQDVLEDMKKQIVYSKERKGYEKRFVLSNVEYSVGVGGIHSIHTPKIFLPQEDEFIGHSDVASMYPSFIIQYKWIPQHLGESFYDVYSDIYYERIESKHSGQKLKATVFKYALNAVTGKMQQETSWMYDPFTVFKIRINGQLILLMLVDRLLELGCKIVQVNTDGVVYIGKKNMENKIQESIHQIEQLTRLSFETDRYEAFYQYAINDYFGVVEGYSQSKNPKLIEKKGMFISDYDNSRLGKGLAPVVIPKAVINYFLTKQPVSEFIKNDRDIRDFLMGQRVDKKFKVEYGDEPIQRINRFYASTNGRFLYKVKEETLGKQKYFNMLARSGVTIYNTFDDKPVEDRHINYTYYISEAQKIVKAFVCQQLELF